MPKELRFTYKEEATANQYWDFNCGPGSLCAILGLTPNEIRPYLIDFEYKRYTNPNLMKAILNNLKVPFREIYCSDDIHEQTPVLNFGLARVQWGGSFKHPKRHSHWIAVDSPYIYDINNACLSIIKNNSTHQWLHCDIWKTLVISFILHHCEPKSNGNWWFTHLLEIPRDHILDITQAIKSRFNLKYPDFTYLREDPFSGDRDINIKYKRVKLVKVRHRQPCGNYAYSNQTHYIEPREIARFETAMVEGKWSKYYICIPCMNRLIEGDI